MNCIQKQQLVSFPKVRIWKPWFRHFNNHKEFRNEGTVHLFSLMALFSYANFRSNERMISGARYMEAPGQWICKLGSLPRILRVHSKRQALEQLDYYEKYGFLTYEWLDKENEIIRFSIINWKEHCTSLQYNYYSYKGSGFFFFPLPVGRMLLSGYDESLWNGIRQIVVYEGLFAKFTQNPDLRERLKDTGNAFLAECAVNDRIWGIGLSMRDPSRLDRAKWQGQNLLGYALMMVREKL